MLTKLIVENFLGMLQMRHNLRMWILIAGYPEGGFEFFCKDGKIYWGFGSFFLQNPSKLKWFPKKRGFDPQIPP